MGNFLYKTPNIHEEYIQTSLSNAYCLGLSSRKEVFEELLIYCDEHPIECKEIKQDLKLRPIY